MSRSPCPPDMAEPCGARFTCSWTARSAVEGLARTPAPRRSVLPKGSIHDRRGKVTMTIRILPPSRAFAAAAAFLLAAPAPAQDIAPLRGEWTGEVTETVEGETTRYRMHVSIDADHGGRPVASVAYSL